jgi:transcriptional regulator with XRE-family HTH domain
MNMYNALLKDLRYDSEDMKYYLQEKLIFEVTECVAEMMEKKGVSRSELAAKLGRTKGYITQLLNGNANMTLRTISDVMWALDSTLKVQPEPANIDYGAYDEQLYDVPESENAYLAPTIKVGSHSLSNIDNQIKLAS